MLCFGYLLQVLEVEHMINPKSRYASQGMHELAWAFPFSNDVGGIQNGGTCRVIIINITIIRY